MYEKVAQYESDSGNQRKYNIFYVIQVQRGPEVHQCNNGGNHPVGWYSMCDVITKKCGIIQITKKGKIIHITRNDEIIQITKKTSHIPAY